MTNIRRRDLLVGSALVLAGETVAQAGLINGHLPPAADPAPAPQSVDPRQWLFFSAAEAALMEVLADRIIPPDPRTAGGKNAGCALFIDRQLAGPYGKQEGLYTSGPFLKGDKQQGPQSAQSPAEIYRAALQALDHFCRKGTDRAGFVELTASRQDEILQGMESGAVEWPGTESKTFFETLLRDIQQGFFADPIYGGNRDMCAWKMIGFPGARYDHREWVGRHNERYPYPPVSISGRPEWNPDKS